jgi:hypothetical protein
MPESVMLWPATEREEISEFLGFLEVRASSIHVILALGNESKKLIGKIRENTSLS